LRYSTTQYNNTAQRGINSVWNNIRGWAWVDIHEQAKLKLLVKYQWACEILCVSF